MAISAYGILKQVYYIKISINIYNISGSLLHSIGGSSYSLSSDSSKIMIMLTVTSTIQVYSIING